MKTIFSFLLCVLCVSAFAPAVRAADSYFGTKGSTNAMNSDTNYFLIVLGDGTNSVIRKVNPRQAKNILAGLGVITNNHAAFLALQSGLSATELSIDGSAGEASSILSTALELYQVQYRTELRLIPTNSALSNIVVDLALTNTVEIYATNNLTFTNWSFSGGWGGLPTSRSSSKLLLIRPQLINRGVNWGQGIGYGVNVHTNANSPLLTTLDAGKTYAASITAVGTNLFISLSLWQ